MIGIYQIVNKSNGRRYVGKSTNITNRWNKHLLDLLNRNHSNKYLQKDFSRVGYSGFTFELIELCEVFELDNLEKHYISLLNTNDYNIVGINREKINKNFDDIIKIRAKIQSLPSGARISKDMINVSDMDWRKIREELLKENLVYTQASNTYKI